MSAQEKPDWCGLKGPQAAEKLRRNKEQVLSRWEALVRQELAEARATRKSILVDSLPTFLDDLCDALESAALQAAARSSLLRVAKMHAEERAAFTDYSVENVIREYELLRKVIFDVLEDDQPLARQERETILAAVTTGMAKAGSEYAELATRRELRAKIQMQESEELFRTIFELAGSGKAIIDIHSGKFVKANRKLCELLGYSSAELEGKTFTELTHPDDREWQMELFQRNLAARSTSWSLEKRYLRKDGEIVWALVTGSFLSDENGRPNRAISTVIDITAQKEANRRVRETVKDLQEEKKITERFTAALTHDLRTPLTAIKMVAQISARRPEDPERVKVALGRVVENVNRADRMIQDLLDAKQMRAGNRLGVELAEMDLVSLARATLDDLTSIYGNRFRLVVAEERLIGYWCAASLRRVIENLAHNAVKYGDPHAPVTVSLRQDGETALLAVHNEGNPIPPGEIGLLFQEYHRSQKAVESGEVGWGLGLMVVQGIVELHGGRVLVRSSEPAGTIFEVCLPLDARPKSAP